MTPSFVFLFLSLSLRLLFVFGDDSFTLPQIEYADLVSMEKSAIYKLTEQFTFLGAIQIANIPKFTLARKEALEDLSECLHSDTSATKMTMKDGSIRYSAGAETKDGVRSPMSSSCGDASYRLRAIIDAVCRQVFAALDSQVRGKNLVMEPSYSTFTDLIANGNHLEHLHSYFPPQNQNSPSINTATMDFHTDAGLMIAMTTGYYSSGLPSSKSGLYISLPDRNVKVETKDDTLILMMGEGAKNWLKPVLGKPFRPVPHALIVDFPAGSENSRSWFGKMYLPPPDALLPVEKIPYSQYHQKAADYQSNKHQSPLACGGSSYSQIVLQNEPCTGADGSPGVFCWTQCMSVSELPCGQSAQCVSSSTGEVDENGKSNHCMDCALQCPAKTITSVYGSSSGSSYCYGDGTTMSMLGFFSVASDEKGSTPCVNLLFKEWTLDNETKMAFACLGVLALGIFIQYLTFLRAQTKNIEDKFQRQAARIIIFGVQVTLSYFLMLAAMTFSVELFCMVCVGLTIGFGLYHSAEPQSKKESKLQSCCPDEEGLERLTEDDGLSLVN